MTAAHSAGIPTMSPHGRALLGAMRRNMELLVEHEKVAPDEVMRIVEATVAHLRSWKPLAVSAMPIDAVPFRTEPLGIAGGVQRGVTRALSDRSWYELLVVDGRLSLYLHDEHGHDADVGLTRAQAAVLGDDLATVKTVLL